MAVRLTGGADVPKRERAWRTAAARQGTRIARNQSAHMTVQRGPPTSARGPRGAVGQTGPTDKTGLMGVWRYGL